MDVCVCCVVSGRVQGVSYRAWVRQRATRLGLRGWAANLPDGRVEVMVCGTQGGVAALRAELWDGPSAAQVTDVAQAPARVTGVEGFVIR